jgi:hypothetical protein
MVARGISNSVTAVHAPDGLWPSRACTGSSESDPRVETATKAGAVGRTPCLGLPNRLCQAIDKICYQYCEYAECICIEMQIGAERSELERLVLHVMHHGLQSGAAHVRPYLLRYVARSFNRSGSRRDTYSLVESLSEPRKKPAKVSNSSAL